MTLVTGFTRESGPHVMLIQLLPSSTVAEGVRLKIGFGTDASEIPGGTLNVDALNSGGVREPLQYWLTKLGLTAMSLEPSPCSTEALVRTEYCGATSRVTLLSFTEW